MTPFIEVLNHIGEAWFAMISSVVAQSFVLVCVAMIICGWLRRSSAALRLWLWQAVALKLLLVPISFVVVLPLWSAERPEVLPYVAQVKHTDPLPYGVAVPREGLVLPTTKAADVKPTTQSYLVAIWGLIVAFQLIHCVQRKRALSRMLRTCEPAPHEDQERLRLLARRLNVTRTVRLMTGEIRVPLVTGILAPTILLPREHCFGQARFDQVVLHELSHVKRNDLLWVWLPELTRMLLFFHPLAYWICRQANLYRETACDECVLAAGVDRRAYATTLLDLAGASAIGDYRAVISRSIPR